MKCGTWAEGWHLGWRGQARILLLLKLLSPFTFVLQTGATVIVAICNLLSLCFAVAL